MRVKALVFLFLSCLSDTVLTLSYNLTGKDENVNLTQWYEYQENGTDALRSSVSSILHKTVKRYPCYVKTVRDAELLLYGSRVWTFPEQNVELKLTYPSKHIEDGDVFKDHLVTGINVVLYTRGAQDKAYIASGGLLQKNVSLTFVCRNTSSLGYQFWVYGVHNDFLDIKTRENIMC